MVKVCHLTSAHNSNDVRIFTKECVSLAKCGYEVSLVARGDNGEKDGVRIVGVGQPPKNRLARMTIFARRVYKKARELNCDIYHFHDPELLPYGLKLKKQGKVVIFDSHENTAESIKEKQWIPSLFCNGIYKAYYAYQKHVCKKLDGIIYVTPNLAEYFSKLNHNAVLITNYPIFNEAFDEPTFQESRIGFAGGISEQWNHEHIVKALEAIPECRYTLCGRIEAAYMEKLSKLPGWKQVDYLGIIPHEAVKAALARCSIGMALLQPSNNSDWFVGTLGNTKIFEEMMAGIPVICTNFQLWREFIDEYNCGICVDPDSPNEIADAIRTIINDPNEAKRMGMNGRRAVRERFNWAVEEEKLFQMYQDLLSKTF